MANGAGPYLKRIGVLDRGRYDTYWQVHCGENGFRPRLLGWGRRCQEPQSGQLSRERFEREEPLSRFVFEVTPKEVALKLGKDAFLLTFALLSLASGRRRGSQALSTHGWPLITLLAFVMVQTVRGLWEGEWLRTALGLRGFVFLIVGFLGGWMADTIPARRLSRALVFLLLLQVALLPFELLWGMPIRGYSRLLSFPNRLAGTLIMPNTLGVLAAVAAAWVESFGPGGRWHRLAWVAAVLLVTMAGSATGWIVLFAVWAYRIAPQRDRRGWVVLSLTLGTLLLVALPAIVGRPDVSESVVGETGRLQALRVALSPGPTLLFGAGLGAGTNAEQTLREQRSTLAGATAVRPPADSTIVMLLRGLGIIPVLLFYALLALSWRRGTTARPLLLALGLSSLTSDLPEAFPLNVLLGLAIARTARPAASQPPA